MAKTLPEVKKLDRADPERVEAEPIAPYPWQRRPDGPRPGEASERTVPEARPQPARPPRRG